MKMFVDGIDRVMTILMYCIIFYCFILPLLFRENIM